MSKDFEPLFFSEMEIPVVPEGAQVVRSHGEAAIIRKPPEGDPFYGKTNFTVTEVEDLKTLQQRVFKRRQNAATIASSIYED